MVAEWQRQRKVSAPVSTTHTHLIAVLSLSILFGLPCDESRLGQVVYACGLLPDLSILPDGIQTEIGEKGDYTGQCRREMAQTLTSLALRRRYTVWGPESSGCTGTCPVLARIIRLPRRCLVRRGRSYGSTHHGELPRGTHSRRTYDHPRFTSCLFMRATCHASSSPRPG